MQIPHLRRLAAAPCLLAALAAHGLTIDGGVDNTLAVGASTRVAGWGGNVGGKLGNNLTINSSAPVRVMTPGVDMLALGRSHTCRLTAEGVRGCWGANDLGQLGDGSTEERHAPTYGWYGYRAVTAGAFHGCALADTGDAECWGSGAQIGDGRYERGAPSPWPSYVSIEGGLTAIAAGGYHTCALTSAGGVKCWGENADGQLGDNSTDWRSTPVAVVGLASGVVAIAAGEYHTCALTSAGAMKCWGYNAYGQLGDNTRTSRLVPVDVAGLSSGVARIAAGESHTCAVTTAGAARCWGFNATGQLGDGTVIDRLIPTPVSTLATGVKAIAAGAGHSCALVSAGIIKCWGANHEGQVGDGSTVTTRLAPVNVSGIADALGIASGSDHACAITVSGSPKCWGRNSNGQLGDDSTTRRLVPSLTQSWMGLVDLADITAISAGMGHTLARRSNGTVYAWGLAHRGQLGLGFGGTLETCFTPGEGTVACSPYALRVPDLFDVTAIGAGWNHSIALKGNGTVWAWGNNDYGQLGVGDTTTRTAPVQVRNASGSGFLTGVSEIAGGYFHNVARQGGLLVSWGRGEVGQLGNGAAIGSLLPTGVSSPPNVVAISSKGSHTLALTSDNTLWGWGLNYYGQVGVGIELNYVANPTQVLTNVVQASAGMSTSMALLANGVPVSWGLNNRGQLGDASFDTCGAYACARQPMGLYAYAGATRVAAAGAHGMVVTDENVLVSFGDNASGQLGNRSKNFGAQFSQTASFDPIGLMFPAITQGTGTSLGLNLPGTGLLLDTLGEGLYFGRQRTVTGTTSVSGVLVNLNPTSINIWGISGGLGGFGVDHTCPSVLPSPGSCNITVSFTPPGTGYQYGYVQVYTDAIDSNLIEYSLVGFGVEPPSPPIGVSATAGNAQASVSFLPPSTDGASPIVSYTATSSPEGIAVSGASSPILVTGLTNGVTYTFKVTATNEYGLPSDPSSPSNAVTPVAFPPLVAVKSRKTHAAAGTFDIVVDSAQPPSGPVTCDSRAIGSGHRVVFQFSGTITSTGTVTTSNGSVASVVISGSEVEVTLSGVADKSRASVTLPNINASGSGVGATVAFLVGDANGSRSVTSADVDFVKARAGQVADATNFAHDVNLSGAITAADILAAKGRLGFVVP